MSGSGSKAISFMAQKSDPCLAFSPTYNSICIFWVNRMSGFLGLLKSARLGDY